MDKIKKKNGFSLWWGTVYIMLKENDQNNKSPFSSWPSTAVNSSKIIGLTFFLKGKSDHYIKLGLILLFSELHEGEKLTSLYKNYYLKTAQWLGYYVDSWRIWVQFPARARDFLPTEVSKQDLGSNQPPVLWITVGLSPGLKQPRHDSDHTLAFSTKVKNVSTRVLNLLSTIFLCIISYEWVFFLFMYI
jgi:hypothetical protein